jgi:hypothetical protein
MATEFQWLQLKFSKHEGKTLPQVALSDPDWFFWAVNNRIFREPLSEQADEIAAKATRIKVPKTDPENWRIKYQFSYDDKFQSFSIISAPDADLPHSHAIIGPCLDLSLPRRAKPYDKLGNRYLLEKFREYFFEGKNLTKERCETFFLDDRNFSFSESVTLV